MAIQFSSILERFNEPATLHMAKLARELRYQGKEVIDLSIGEPDFDVPNHIKQAAIKAIEDNFSHYPPVAGFLDLKESICKKFDKENHLSYKPSNIIVSTGAKQSIANLILTLIDIGNEVLIPTPYWVTYSEIVKLAGGKVKFVSTQIENNYKITPQQLEENLTDKTKLFMFSSPSNPSGAFYSEGELEELVKVFEKFPNVFIMSDEIYEHINYTGQHHSIAKYPSMKSRVAIINGMSKGFAMTGWRIGYLATENEELVKACEKIQGQCTSGANTIAQKASVVALNSSLNPTQEMAEELKRRKDIIVDFFKSLPNVKISIPEGAFYIFPDMSAYFGKKTKTGKLISNAETLSFHFLNYSYVSSVPGFAFGTPECIRFSYANSQENIKKALERIKNTLLELS